MTRYAKTVAAVIGALATAATLGLLPEDVAAWLPVVIAFATAIGVYAVPNTPPAGQPADPNVSEVGPGAEADWVNASLADQRRRAQGG